VIGFNPGLGFLPTSAISSSVSRRPGDRFQSRSGFSPYFGGRRGAAGSRALDVSIPVWVFSLLRPRVGPSSVRLSPVFQSRSGFSPYFGVIVTAVSHYRTDCPTTGSRFQSRSGFSPYFGSPFTIGGDVGIEFQSRSGFSPYFGVLAPFEFDGRLHVSIPVWVFSLLRHFLGV